MNQLEKGKNKDPVNLHQEASKEDLMKLEVYIFYVMIFEYNLNNS